MTGGARNFSLRTIDPIFLFLLLVAQTFLNSRELSSIWPNEIEKFLNSLLLPEHKYINPENRKNESEET